MSMYTSTANDNFVVRSGVTCAAGSAARPVAGCILGRSCSDIREGCAKRKVLHRGAGQGGWWSHLIGLMQQQPVYVCYSKISICKRRLHHLHNGRGSFGWLVRCCDNKQ